MNHAPHKRPRDVEHHKQLVYVWQLPVRIFHWVTAACIAVLFLTGLYMAFPILTTPGEPFDHFLMARVRQIHFIAAFVWLCVFALRMYWFFAGNSFARSGMPYFWRRSWWRDVAHEAVTYVLVRPSRAPRIGHNALAGLSYTIFPVALGFAQILTGLALYSEANPSGIWGRLTGWVIPLMGGSFRVHMWHHLFAWAFLWFVMLHVYIVIYDSIRDRNSLVESMITGYKTRHDTEIVHGR
jgi:Ni/Fe-hydrogenase 1 B-type cytochrome subunit